MSLCAKFQTCPSNTACRFWWGVVLVVVVVVLVLVLVLVVLAFVVVVIVARDDVGREY